MNAISFSNAQKTSVATNFFGSTTISPFDNNLTFDRVIQEKRDRNNPRIHSINSNAILRKLMRDELDSLLKITLVCNSTLDGLVMWDTLFNQTIQTGMMSCVFLADTDFSPIPQKQVVRDSSFLNYAMAHTRLALNRIYVGNKVGIGIYDVASKTVYTLLYEIMSECMVQVGNCADELGQSPLSHAINLELLQICRLNTDGEGDRIDVREDLETTEVQEAFVGCLVNSAMDIMNAWSWKPHFLPEKVSSWDRLTIESLVEVEAENTDVSDYDDFEEACRNVYNMGRKLRINRERDTPAPANGKKGSGNNNNTPRPLTPVIKVTTIAGNEMLVVKLFDRNSQAEQTFKFSKDSLGKSAFAERFLLNKDLEVADISDVSGVMVLSSDRFGTNSFVRYLTVNF